MITGVDANVLLDVFSEDPAHSAASAAALRRCMIEGSLVACEIVWAEVAARFESAAAFGDAMRRLGVSYSAIDEETAAAAGRAWGSYRTAGGTRRRLVPDFLVGAHAIRGADRLLTRDRGFYRRHFQRLVVVDPTVSPG